MGISGDFQICRSEKMSQVELKMTKSRVKYCEKTVVEQDDLSENVVEGNIKEVLYKVRKTSAIPIVLWKRKF